MKYGYCINHSNTYAVNAKKLCGICTKERHERSAGSRGLTINKEKNDNARYKSSNENKGFTLNKNDDECNERGYETRMPVRPIESKKTKIKPISSDKANELAELASIKKRKISVQGKECELCGKSGEVDLFHIIGVGDKKHSTNETNLLLSCRYCHLVWGANDWAKIVKFRNFAEIMERLKSLDEGKYWKLFHKLEPFLNKLNII